MAQRRPVTALAIGALAIATLLATRSASRAAAPPPPPPSPIPISQVPLTVVLPAHPQIVLALANSQSMDGDLSGAIMTGSGSLPGAVGTGLAGSSSPVNYTIPPNFTPPVNAGSGGQAPYTATLSDGVTLADNYASRMNVAKAGLSAILNSYMQYADFALMDYSTANLGEYTTWVYYMSAAGGFTFTNTPGTSPYVNNPCYNANVALSDAYDQACNALLSNYGAPSGILTQPYMLIGSTGITGDTIGATSDNPAINDVFYEGPQYQPPVCVSGQPSASDPYTSFSLANYESGSVIEWYSLQWGASGYTYTCDPGMSPTNAGYVPYSAQVLLAQRGFGYDATSVSATTGQLVVPMQSAGNVPTPTSVATAIAAFTPYLQPETNNLGSTEVKSVAQQGPMAGLVKGAETYFSTTNPSSTNACAPKRFIVLITDGLPTKDLSGHNWPPLGSISASGANTNPTGPGWNVWATFNANGSLASTNDQALTDAIAQISAAANSNVLTYVIGLGAGVGAPGSPAANTLTAMAVAGGTGGYFAANSPDQLTADLQVILQDILNSNQSDASSTVNTTGLNSTSMAFQPSFNTSDTDHDWTGDVKAYSINPNTGVVNTSVVQWSAQAQLDAQSAGAGWKNNRIIATWDPATGAGTPFEWTPGTTATTGIAVSTQLGAELATNPADTNGQDALDYLRGDAQFSTTGGGSYRPRTHVLGDIVDSAPLYIGAPSGPYQSSTYFAFMNARMNRPQVLYVGANDGMLHAFSATTGQELFAYIPTGVFANLIQLTNPYYNQQHHFYVDGAPQASDVQFSDGNWHTVLVSGERGGGNSVFALDVTDPASITAGGETQLAHDVLWDFTDANLGLSYSTPAIVQTAYGTSGNNLGFTVFFGNGYNSTSQMPYLYALDPKTGTSLPGTPINLCAAVPTACNSALPNGLSSVTVTNNLGALSAAATTLYAGDLQGNVWRVDIHDPNPLNWVVTVLFQASDPSAAPQPITTAPAVSLNPRFPDLPGTMVYVGTGQLLSAQDLTSTQIQTMYGVYDSDSNTSTLNRNSLVSQALSAETVGAQTLRFVSGQQVALPTQQGWYVDLDVVSGGVQSDPGERIVTDPRLLGGALSVVTLQPNASTQTAMATRPHADPLDMNPSGSRRARSMLARTRSQARKPAHAAASLEPPAPASSTPDLVVRLGPEPAGAGVPSNPVAASSPGYRDSWSAAHLWPVVLGVTPPPTLQSCSVTPTNPTISLGGGQQFTAVGHYSDGSTQNLTGQATWSSSNAAVASISAGGDASSAGLGSTTITASLDSGSIVCSTTLTVVNPPPPPTLQYCFVWPGNPTIYLGNPEQFSVGEVYSNGSWNWTSGTWSSSNTGVATINNNGYAVSTGIGSSTITAVIDGGAFTCTTTLTVVSVPTLVSIQVVPPNPTITVGQSKQFTANGIYSNGSVQNLSNLVTWSSSDIAVATMSGHGLATGLLAGTTSITATYESLSGSTTLTVVAPTTGPPPQCPTGPVAYLMEFNFAGGAFTTPVFNYNGPGTSMSSLLPANGVLLGSVYASAPVFNTFAAGINGTGGVIMNITESTGNMVPIFMPGLSRERFAWWEIR